MKLPWKSSLGFSRQRSECLHRGWREGGKVGWPSLSHTRGPVAAALEQLERDEGEIRSFQALDAGLGSRWLIC